METLQDFVSARFADLTAASSLTDRARHVLNAVTSAASSVRPAAHAPASPRLDRVLVGHHLPLINPGVERC